MRLHVGALDRRADVDVADLRDREAVQRRAAGRRSARRPRARARVRRALKKPIAMNSAAPAAAPRAPSGSGQRGSDAERPRQQQHHVAQQRQHQQRREDAERQHAGPGLAVGRGPVARATAEERQRNQNRRGQQQALKPHGARGPGSSGTMRQPMYRCSSADSHRANMAADDARRGAFKRRWSAGDPAHVNRSVYFWTRSVSVRPTAPPETACRAVRKPETRDADPDRRVA